MGLSSLKSYAGQSGLGSRLLKDAPEARRHAGNLAHALKTPLTVIMNAATANADDLGDRQ